MFAGKLVTVSAPVYIRTFVPKKAKGKRTDRGVNVRMCYEKHGRTLFACQALRGSGIECVTPHVGTRRISCHVLFGRGGLESALMCRE
jgi:hypothetical protein